MMLNNIIETTVENFEKMDSNSEYEVYDEERMEWVSYKESCYFPKGGFPNIEYANEKINAITISMNSKTYTFGLESIDSNILKVGQNYKKFDSEKEMLDAFLVLWGRLDIDIITGWNVTFFDLPYLFARIQNILGNSEVDRLSPWEQSSRTKVTVMGKEQYKVNILGISVIDYIDVYKKYKMKTQESYKLDFIAKEELGYGKVDYDGPLHLLYTENYSKFIEYNIRDVTIVEELEKKLNFIGLAMEIAYFTKANFSDIFYNTRIWDIVIYSFLKSKKMLPHIKNGDDEYSSEEDEGYEGAFVKPSKPGLFKWVASFDFTSLYPSLIRSFNIGPEVEYYKKVELNVETFHSEPEYMRELLSDAIKENYTIASNGTLYRRDKIGFLAELMGIFFDYRKVAKKRASDASKEIEIIEQEMKKRGMDIK